MASPDKVDVDSLPPVQYLILENLGSRARLGNTTWPFPTRFGTALRALESLGLVHLGNCPSDHARNVSLTEAGRAAVLSKQHVSPIVRDLWMSIQPALRTGNTRLLEVVLQEWFTRNGLKASTVTRRDTAVVIPSELAGALGALAAALRNSPGLEDMAGIVEDLTAGR